MASDPFYLNLPHIWEYMCLPWCPIWRNRHVDNKFYLLLPYLWFLRHSLNFAIPKIT
jgi:hypothetical protein